MSELRWVEIDELQRLREGDDTAMASIFDRYADRLKYWVLRQPATRSDGLAEEITHEAFVAFFNRSRWSERAYVKVKTIGGYLYKAARSLVATEARRVKHDQSLQEKLSKVPVLPPAQPDTIALSNETQRLLENAVDALPLKDQPFARYRYLEDMTVSETATLVGSDWETTKKRLARIRKRLARALYSHFFGSNNGNGSSKATKKDANKDDEVTQ